MRVFLKQKTGVPVEENRENTGLNMGIGNVHCTGNKKN